MSKPISMCSGCGWQKKTHCQIIKDPKYFFSKYGYCFAWADKAIIEEIEKEIVAYSVMYKHKRMTEERYDAEPTE